MSFTLQQLADLVQGTILGDPSLSINAARILQEAAEGDITFLENEKNLPKLHASKASAAVVGPGVPLNGKALIQVKDPLGAFTTIVRRMHGRPESPSCGIDPRAAVHPTVRIGADPSIYPFAVIGENTVLGDRCRIHPGVVIGRDCKLGNDVVLHPNAVLYDGIELGDRVIVHANAVIGADGFGYRFQNGRHAKVLQLGTVMVGADVEVGACATIDRGTFQATQVGEGTKIDNLVQIAHNCRIGRHNIFASQVGVAGSCSTDDYVICAGQVGIADHLHIGAGALVGAKSGVSKDVPPGYRMFGIPAKPERDQKRLLANLEKVAAMRQDLKRIKRHLGLSDVEAST